MAIPWYSSDLPFTNTPDPNLDLLSIEQNTQPKSQPGTFPANNKKLLSINSVRNILIKSNNLFKLPERDIDKITCIPGEGDAYHQDSTGDYTGHNFYHTGLINKAFLPMRLALMAVGRWPFVMRMKPVTSRAKRRYQFDNNNEDLTRRLFVSNGKVRNYDDTWKTFLWLYFGMTTLFISFVLVMSTMGFFDFFLEWKLLPGDHWDLLQEKSKNIFRDNLVMFLLIWGCLMHSAVSSISLFINRKKVARILNFWNVAADELLINEVRSHRRFLIASNFGYILFLVLLYFAYSAWDIRLIQDGAYLFGVLSIRPLLNEKQVKCVTTWELQIFGIITIIYSIYASRAFLFIFSFKCRLLRSLFRVWNARLVSFLKKSENNMNEKPEITAVQEKLECQRLLSDMAILLKMVKQMDKMFATILQAYYAVQLLNMCFELYMLAKSGSVEFTRSDDDRRGLDIITAILTLCQNVYFFFTVSLDGAYVGEEADKGQEVLRRHPITPEASVQKRYLVYNLGFIYNKRIALTGGKFFTIDRPFIITVLGAVLTYFVIILQVEPTLQKKTASEKLG